MSIWSALMFMTLGAAVSEVYNLYAWHKYEQGRREVLESRRAAERYNNQYNNFNQYR